MAVTGRGRRPAPPRRVPDRHGGLALFGRIWPGGRAAASDDGVALVDPSGRLVALGPGRDIEVPTQFRRLGGPTSWVGPGVVDAHVHLAYGSPEQELAGGVVGLRDLGAPLERALEWRTQAGEGAPYVAVAGPLLTAPGGYPANGWGADGFARFLAGPEDAAAAVAEVASAGMDVVKLALEPAGGQPVPSPEVAGAVVRAAHDHGLPAVAHALTAGMVERALDAGVDELVHTPTERLPNRLIDRMVAAGVSVISTLQTLVAGGDGAGAMANARALVAAGVPLLYGTDLGNAGTSAGVDPRELALLTEAGLSPEAALRAATEGAARAAGMSGPSGHLVVGGRADLVLLAGDPLLEWDSWRRPVAVVAGESAVLR